MFYLHFHSSMLQSYFFILFPSFPLLLFFSSFNPPPHFIIFSLMLIPHSFVFLYFFPSPFVHQNLAITRTPTLLLYIWVGCGKVIKKKLGKLQKYMFFAMTIIFAHSTNSLNSLCPKQKLSARKHTTFH